MKFVIFGSPSSIDLDVLVIVDSIGEAHHSKELCLKLNSLIKTKMNSSKEVNSNLGVIQNGKVINCFKGTPDEVNNSIFFTYSLHSQLFENPVLFIEARNVFLKVSRTLRICLGLFSKTEHRLLVKKALASNISDKIEALSKINFSLDYEFGKKCQI